MLENDVYRLLAREAIRDLPAQYCDCVWRDDIEGLVSLFDQEGTFYGVFNGIETTITGHDKLRDFYLSATDFMPRPYIHNHVVELLENDYAKGRCYLDLRSARNNMDWLGAGYYEDEYRLSSVGWKFQSRRFTALRMEELPAGIQT
jgi:hypothetical protein